MPAAVPEAKACPPRRSGADVARTARRNKAAPTDSRLIGAETRAEILARLGELFRRRLPAVRVVDQFDADDSQQGTEHGDRDRQDDESEPLKISHRSHLSTIWPRTCRQTTGTAHTMAPIMTACAGMAWPSKMPAAIGAAMPTVKLVPAIVFSNVASNWMRALWI